MPKPKMNNTPPSEKQLERRTKPFQIETDQGPKRLLFAELEQQAGMRKDAARTAQRDRRAAFALMRQERIEMRAIRRFHRWLRQIEREKPWRYFRVKVPRSVRKPVRRKRDEPMRSMTRIQLPRMKRVPVDRHGNRGVFWKYDYDSAVGHAWGIARRRVLYALDPSHAELSPTGDPIFATNMGETDAEIAAAADLIELTQRATRANAKISANCILQLPHDVPVEVRERIMRRVAHENFGQFGLPYVACLHRPDPEGDQRNFHMHIWSSQRPMRRNGEYDWAMSDDYRADLSGPEYHLHLRRVVADILTDEVQRFGLNRSYTHRSNAARGLVNKPQQKLGPAKTEQVRAGLHVPVNEANRDKIRQAETYDHRMAAQHNQTGQSGRELDLSGHSTPPSAAPERLNLRPVQLPSRPTRSRRLNVGKVALPRALPAPEKLNLKTVAVPSAPRKTSPPLKLRKAAEPISAKALQVRQTPLGLGAVSEVKVPVAVRRVSVKPVAEPSGKFPAQPSGPLIPTSLNERVQALTLLLEQQHQRRKIAHEKAVEKAPEPVVAAQARKPIKKAASTWVDPEQWKREAVIRYIRDEAIPIVVHKYEYRPAVAVPFETDLSRNVMQAMFDIEFRRQADEQEKVIRAIVKVLEKPADLELQSEPIRQRIDQNERGLFDRWAHQRWQWMMNNARRIKRQEAEKRLAQLEKNDKVQPLSPNERQAVYDELCLWSPDAAKTPSGMRLAASLEGDRQAKRPPPMMPPPDLGFGR